MSPYQWRPMRAADLPHVMAIADLVHAGYFEAEEVFAFGNVEDVGVHIRRDMQA